jgi:hypothetical protein
MPASSNCAVDCHLCLGLLVGVPHPVVTPPVAPFLMPSFKVFFFPLPPQVVAAACNILFPFFTRLATPLIHFYFTAESFAALEQYLTPNFSKRVEKTAAVTSFLAHRNI